MPALSICPRCLKPTADVSSCCRKRRAETVEKNQRRAAKAKRNGLNRSAWLGLLQRAKARAGWRCQRCGRHRDELGENERLTGHLRPQLAGDHCRATIEDVEVLCSTCHGRADGARSRGGRGE